MAKRRAAAQAVGVCFCFRSLAREEIIREESELKIARFDISVSILGLNAGLGRKFQLDKGVGDVILLVIVEAKPVRRKVGVPKAEGTLLVDAGDDTFSSPGVIFTAKAACLQGHADCG